MGHHIIKQQTKKLRIRTSDSKQIFRNFVENVLYSLENENIIFNRNSIWDSCTFLQVIEESTCCYSLWANPTDLYYWCLEDLHWNDCIVISYEWRIYNANLLKKKH